MELMAFLICCPDFCKWCRLELNKNPFCCRYVDDLFKLDTSIESRNLKEFEEVINQETFWVASEILKEPNALKRMKTIKHFIKIALHCRECKNFNSMFAIIRSVHKVVRWAHYGLGTYSTGDKIKLLKVFFFFLKLLLIHSFYMLMYGGMHKLQSSSLLLHVGSFTAATV